MRAASLPRLPSHPVVERIRRFRLLYAVAVNSVAVVILVAVAMASRVHEYRTVGFVEMKPVRASGRPDAATLDTVSECIRRAAGDSPLTALLNECQAASAPSTRRKSEADAESRTWTPAELDRLRERFAFAVVPVEGRDTVRVSVMFSGRGTRLEDAVVRGFLGSISDQVTLASSIPSLHRPVALTDDQLVRMKQDRDHLLQEANSRLQEINLQLVGLGNDLIAAEEREQAWKQLRVASQNSTETPSAPAAPQPTSGESQTRFANPFFQASFSPPAAPDASAGAPVPATPEIGLSGTRERFAAIPLAELSMTFIEIERQWGQALQPLETLLRNQAVTASVSPLRPVSRSEVYQLPAGMRAPREWLLLTLAVALVAGCVLASGIDARWHDPGFVAPGEIEEQLGVPLVGTIRGPAAGATPRRHWAVRILKLNEVVVFSTLLAICVAAIASPEIRQLLIENPLHALVRIVWSVRSIF